MKNLMTGMPIVMIIGIICFVLSELFPKASIAEIIVISCWFLAGLAVTWVIGYIVNANLE